MVKLELVKNNYPDRDVPKSIATTTVYFETKSCRDILGLKKCIGNVTQ